MSQNPAVAIVRSQLEQLITVGELAAIEQCSKQLIYEGVRFKGWPHYRQGRVIKFSATQILQIREMQRCDADPNRRPPRRRPRKKPAAAAA